MKHKAVLFSDWKKTCITVILNTVSDDQDCIDLPYEDLPYED